MKITSSVRLLVLVALCAPAAAHAQTLYTTDFNGSGNINSYNAAGTATTGFTPPTGSGSNGVAVSGNTLYVANYNSGTINTYNATSGAAIGTFASLAGVQGLTLSGTNLYAASNNGTVTDYNTSTGATMTGFTPFTLTGGIAAATAVSGNVLYASNGGSTVGEFSATTGAAINTSFITGQNTAWGLAVSGNNLFVVNRSGNTIAEYNATTGAVVNSSFVSGFEVCGIADAGGVLYAVGEANNRVYEYNDTTGAAITSFALPSGDSDAQSIAVVPEPATWAAGTLTLVAAGFALRRRGASAV